MRRLVSPLLGLIVAGCAAAPSAGQPAGGVTLRGRAALGAYALQATSYVKGDITSVKVFLKKAGGTESQIGTLSSPDAPVEIRNLGHDATYTVRLEAYQGATRIDSRTASGNETTVTTTTAPLIEDVTFKLALAGDTFAGTAKGGIEVTDGVVADGVATPTVAVIDD